MLATHVVPLKKLLAPVQPVHFDGPAPEQEQQVESHALHKLLAASKGKLIF